MATEDSNVDKVNSVFEGDVLGSSKDSVLKSVDRISNSVENIEKSFNKSNELLFQLTKNAKSSNSANFYSRADEKINKEPLYSSSKFNKSSFKNSTSKNSGNAVDEILSGFEDALSEYLGISDINKNYNKYIDNIKQNLASKLGTSSDEVLSVITKEYVKSIPQSNTLVSKLLKPLTSSISNFGKFYSEGFENVIKSGAKAYDNTLHKLNPKLASMFSFESLISDTEDEKNVTENNRDSKNNVSKISDIKDLYVNNIIVQSAIQTSASKSNVSKDSTTSLVDSKYSHIKLGDNGLYNTDTKNDKLDTKQPSSLEELGSDALNSAGNAAANAFLKGDDIASIGKAAVSGFGTALKSAGPQLIATYLFDGITNELGEFLGHISEAVNKVAKVADRWDESRWAAVEAEEKRMQQDVETMIEQPFKILEDAAQKVYDTWDAALQTITATQGYDKSGLQDLMSAYASRLRQEGLSDVVGTTDVTSMLQSILNAGLSGKVAEEFAYQATVLNKAIPTEDFTSYASSYASLASSYMALGYSQQEALQYANEQLQLFASNVLTASREVSGGFTTSLTGVSGLFDEIVKISQTAGTTNTSNLSSALSIVQAIAGQVSPDVGNSIVSQIVSAATGGNDSSLVALRSLAGTGASNTAFLQALAKNPNQVLANLFSGLSDMFDKSTDNYMEVAYSLADTFGITADAMARVDWNRLVDELRSNSSSSAALSQNMSLLASGETTTSAESQRLAQINEYMIEEGLAYVLDNEAARQIQQHMWDQELAAEMQEATYGVEFKGATLELFTSIESLLGGIANVLSFGLLNVAQAVESNNDYNNMKSDITAMLEAGKVGEGDLKQLHDLVTYDVGSLTKVPSYMDFWGLESAYQGQFYNVYSAAQDAKLSSAPSVSGPSSMYSWGNTGKSALQSMGTSPMGSLLEGTSSSSATSQISKQTGAALNNWLSTMSSFISEGKSFGDWLNSASEYGFSDASAAMEQAGYTESDLKKAYIQEGTNQAVEQAVQEHEKERQFWESGINWWDVVYPQDRDAWNVKYDLNFSTWTTLFSDKMQSWSELYTNTMMLFTENLNSKYSEWVELYTESVAETHKKLQYSNNQFDKEFVQGFLYDWRDYYIGEHTHYREATNFDKSLKTINTEKTQTGEAVLALAESLTKNYEDLADPAVQTNVLLGQIVMLLQSILTAQTSGSGLTLPTALSALGLNITDPKSSKTLNTI